MSRLQTAFRGQSESCAALGSPFMAQLMRLCAERWPDHGTVAEHLRSWPGDLGPSAASLPLRLAGGLHALVLTGLSQRLSEVYPPNEVTDDALWDEVIHALDKHADFLLDWVQNAPQTNEVRRAAALIPVAHMLTHRLEAPIVVSELGASAGLNMNFDLFQLEVDQTRFGPSSAVQLTPDWRGPCPVATQLEITERRGVDLNPLDPSNAADALRLIAYLWPDQEDRLLRSRAAMALPPAPVDRGDAITWLSERLSQWHSTPHLIYTTVAWQYFPEDAQKRGIAALEQAGAEATPEAPLAFLTMEADGHAPGAALTLRLWPEDLTLSLARVDFHGRWITWTGPTAL